MPRLNNGDAFPMLTLDTVEHGTISVARRLPRCRPDVPRVLVPLLQRATPAFARANEKLNELGIKVVALSVDDNAAAASLVEKHRLNFPVGYGVDAETIAASTGAYVNDNPRYFQSTGFVLNPDGKVITAVYSSGAIGRLVAEDVIGFVRYVKSQR